MVECLGEVSPVHSVRCWRSSQCNRLRRLRLRQVRFEAGP